MTDWDDDGVQADELEEGFIELTDIVLDEPESEADDDIIDLVDIVREEKSDLNLDMVEDEDSDLNLDMVEEEETDLNLDIIRVDPVGEIEDFAEDLEFKENMTTSQGIDSDDVSLPKFPDVTSDQIEAALEKVIEKQFADKIQAILFQVMEKVIEREITGIRESLQKDLDQIGNV